MEQKMESTIEGLGLTTVEHCSQHFSQGHPQGGSYQAGTPPLMYLRLALG